MNKNTRIASRNFVGNTTAMSRPSAQSNLFGQKNSTVTTGHQQHASTHAMQTRSQTAMMVLNSGTNTNASTSLGPDGPQTASQKLLGGSSQKHFLPAAGRDHQLHLRGSPKQQHLLMVKPTKKGSKTKVSAATHHHATRSEPHSGGISARSTHNNGPQHQPASSYTTKTFYSNYIGANSKAVSGATNSQASSFATKKSRNNSYSTVNVTGGVGAANKDNAAASSAVGANPSTSTSHITTSGPNSAIKQSQTQANLMAQSGVGVAGQLASSSLMHSQVQGIQPQSSMTLSSSRLLSSLHERLNSDSLHHTAKSNKAAAAAVAAARVNANISAAAAQQHHHHQQQHQTQASAQKLAVPDLAQKLLKTQMSLDLKGLSKIAQQQKTRVAGKGQKSNRAIVPQNKVSIVLNSTTNQWEQVDQPHGASAASLPHSNSLLAHQLTTMIGGSKHEQSMRSISRRRNEKGIGKKVTTREHSINSVLHDKHVVDDKHHSRLIGGQHDSALTTAKVSKKGLASQLQYASSGAAGQLKTSNTSKKRVGSGLQNELLASLNLKNYQKGLVQNSQQLSTQHSQRAFASPKTGGNSSFKFHGGAGVSNQSMSQFEGLTPKQTTKVYQRVHTRKTESKLRASQISNQNAETTNCSYNQYGIVEGGTSQSLNTQPNPLAPPTGAGVAGANHAASSNALQALPSGSGSHTGYMTSLGHNSPDVLTPLISGNQSQINYRHSRVQSSVVESFNARQASQSALGLVGQSSTISPQHLSQNLLPPTTTTSSQLQQQSQPGPSQVTANSSSTKGRISMASTKPKKPSLTQQQQIQEKIRHLQQLELATSGHQASSGLGAGGSGHHTKSLSQADRNMMSVLNTLGNNASSTRRNHLSSATGQHEGLTLGSTKKLSSRAAVHKSAQQMHESSAATSQKLLQEKLIKKAQDKLGGKSLNPNQIRESKTTKDLVSGMVGQGGVAQTSSASILAQHNQNHSLASLPLATTTVRTAKTRQQAAAAEKAKKRVGDELGQTQGRPLTQIELVGVYKYTRSSQQKQRRSDAGMRQEPSPKKAMSRSKISSSGLAQTKFGRHHGEYQSHQKPIERHSHVSSTVQSGTTKQGLRPASHVRQRMDRAYKQFCDNGEIEPQASSKNQTTILHQSTTQKLQAKAKGSSKQQKAAMLAAAQKQAQLAAERAQSKQLEESETVLRKRVGKSASIKRKTAVRGGKTFFKPVRQVGDQDTGSDPDTGPGGVPSDETPIGGGPGLCCSRLFAPAPLPPQPIQNPIAASGARPAGASKSQAYFSLFCSCLGQSTTEEQLHHHHLQQQHQRTTLNQGTDYKPEVADKRQSRDMLQLSQAQMLKAATRQRYKEDVLSCTDDGQEDDSIGELGVRAPYEIEYSKRKRREVSEPPRHYSSIKMQKMFNEADLLVLEDRSNSRVRSFKIFDDKRVFPEIYEKQEFQPLDKEEKHDECDYDTEPEHVVKARELMLEDLTESIKFYVEEQPLDLVYNIHKKYK